MSAFAPLFSFLMALFGVTFVAASALTSAATTSTDPIADAPPTTISTFMKTSNELNPTAIYAGLRVFYSIQANDDNGLASVTVNAPGMKSTPPDITLCSDGAKTCSAPYYAFIPSAPGNYTITVKATDTAGKTATQILTFTAQGCVTNSECGGTYFPSNGATFCGLEGTSRYDKRMKYQVVSVCSAGSCNEKTEPGVLEDCATSSKMCGFSQVNGGQFQCVVIPSVTCAPNAKITSSCLCGPENSDGIAYGYCCVDSSNKKYLSPFVCPVPSPAPVPGAGAPEPSTDEAGAWAQVDIASGKIENIVVCTRAVCGINGEYHGYVPPPTWTTGSVWWPTSKRYIWQMAGQAGYSSGTFNFNTYVFTVQGGTIYNGLFTPTPTPVVTPSPTSTPSTTSPSTTSSRPTTFTCPDGTVLPTGSLCPIKQLTCGSNEAWSPDGRCAPLGDPVCSYVGSVSTCYRPFLSPTSTPTKTPTQTPTYVTPIIIPPFTQTPTSTLAQPTPAPIAQCLQVGGVWCYTESSQSNIGYCATAKSGCERKPETPQGDEQQFFAERRAILQDLRAIERLVKQDAVDVDAKLLKAYKEKLLALKPGEEKDLSVLQNYRKKITELRSDEETQAALPSLVDPRAEAKALKQMKQGLRPFERYLMTIETKVTQVKKSGITVDASAEEAIAAAKAVAKQVKDAKTYADVRDVADSMPDIGQALNDTLPRLEELFKLSRVFSVLDKKIVEAERAIAETRVVAKKLKLDVTDNIAEMQALLAGAKEVIAAVKAGTVATDDLASTLGETVSDKVSGVFDLAVHIQTVGGIRQAVNRAATDAKRYELRIHRLEKAKENMQTASALLEQFNEQLAGLKDLSKQKLTPESGDQIINSVRSMSDIRDELEDTLRLSKPDALETQIKQLFSASGEKLKPFDVEKLEQEVL